LEIGTTPFSRDEMRARIPEFLDLHAKRPIRENRGGMRAPHLFATWFMVQKLAPTHIVESGVFKGLGTWLLAEAAPNARLYCIDPDPAARVYHSPRATYLTEDFSKLTWDLPRETTLLFFDDHQDELRRVEESRRFGFRHVIFEDNYPPGQGDCFSLKQGLMGVERRETRSPLSAFVDKLTPKRRKGNARTALEAMLDGYYEFPPVVRVGETRWGDAWTDERYPTPEALFPSPADVPCDTERLFASEAAFYTWICYAALRTA
jgi:hypothetical protein